MVFLRSPKSRRALPRLGLCRPAFSVFGLLLLLAAGSFCAQAQMTNVVLHLKNGDRLAGAVVSEDTNHVVITTSWIKNLDVPVDQIASREPGWAQTNAAPALAAQTNAAPNLQTNVASQKSVPAIRVVTNTVVALNPSSPIPVPTVPTPPSAKPGNKHWKGEARVGADFLYGANNQQIYSGRFKLTYERPYASNPKEFFRNILDFSADYGWTKTLSSTNQQTVQSANRVDGSDKTDVDVGKRVYVYDLAAAGYDSVRKIDSRYELGPGAGYHLFTQTNFLLNTESGVDYQAEYRSDNTTERDFFYRFAEDLTWKLNHKVTLTEKMEVFPEVTLDKYRFRFESNLSYNLWLSFSLNLTVLDLYDSQPALDIPYNDLQIRSSLGFKF